MAYIMQVVVYPTVFEQPIIRKLRVISIHLDRDAANLRGMLVQFLYLFIRQTVASFFRVDVCMV